MNIQVGDVNDNAPRFHNQPYSVRISEVGFFFPFEELLLVNFLKKKLLQLVEKESFLP